MKDGEVKPNQPVTEQVCVARTGTFNAKLNGIHEDVKIIKQHVNPIVLKLQQAFEDHIEEEGKNQKRQARSIAIISAIIAGGSLIVAICAIMK